LGPGPWFFCPIPGAVRGKRFPPRRNGPAPAAVPKRPPASVGASGPGPRPGAYPAGLPWGRVGGPARLVLLLRLGGACGPRWLFCFQPPPRNVPAGVAPHGPPRPPPNRFASAERRSTCVLLPNACSFRKSTLIHSPFFVHPGALPSPKKRPWLKDVSFLRRKKMPRNEIPTAPRVFFPRPGGPRPPPSPPHRPPSASPPPHALVTQRRKNARPPFSPPNNVAT